MPTRPDANILIMGLRGAGKSTTARLLGERLGRPSLDLDDSTLSRLGVRTVAEAWSAHGESGFREAESASLREVLRGAGMVIALGGGTPTAPGAEAMIREAQRAGRAVVVYLHAPAELLAERVRNDPPDHRPRLLGLDHGGAVAEMQAVYLKRHGLYVSLADHIIDASRGRDEVVGDVVRVCAGA